MVMRVVTASRFSTSLCVQAVPVTLHSAIPVVLLAAHTIRVVVGRRCLAQSARLAVLATKRKPHKFTAARCVGHE